MFFASGSFRMNLKNSTSFLGCRRAFCLPFWRALRNVAFLCQQSISHHSGRQNLLQPPKNVVNCFSFKFILKSLNELRKLVKMVFYKKVYYKNWWLQIIPPFGTPLTHNSNSSGTFWTHLVYLSIVQLLKMLFWAIISIVKIYNLDH